MDWLNGTLKHYPTDEVEGNVVLWYRPAYPYDPELRKLALKKPAGVIMVQDKRGTAGEGMYAVDGKNRNSINFPVCEIYVIKKINVTALPDNTYVRVQFDENPWKKIKDGPFYPIMNSVTSLWELAIVLLGIYRINQFYNYDQHFSLLSIGPLCLALEIIASGIRFGHTLLDPFYSARMYSSVAQGVLVTVHLPFALASGILLTFYCAYTPNPKVQGANFTHFSIFFFFFVGQGE